MSTVKVVCPACHHVVLPSTFAGEGKDLGLSKGYENERRAKVQKQDREPARSLRLWYSRNGDMVAVACLMVIVCCTLVVIVPPLKRVQEQRRQHQQAVWEQAQLEAKQSEFERRVAEGLVSPVEYAGIFIGAGPEDVIARLGRPDSTSNGDTVYYYRRRVLHPVTGKLDTLIITFKVDELSPKPRMAYVQAGVGGAHY